MNRLGHVVPVDFPCWEVGIGLRFFRIGTNAIIGGMAKGLSALQYRILKAFGVAPHEDSCQLSGARLPTFCRH
jgi:hypothetical protein